MHRGRSHRLDEALKNAIVGGRVRVFEAAATKSKESLLIHCHKRSNAMKMGTKIRASKMYFIIFLFMIL
jgi:hypothetical protein